MSLGNAGQGALSTGDEEADADCDSHSVSESPVLFSLEPSVISDIDSSASPLDVIVAEDQKQRPALELERT